MSLDKLSKQLAASTINEKDASGSNVKPPKLPPIEQWHPPYCGAIDLEIKANGDWYYGGTIFKRLALVKLFASVLLKEQGADSDDYFLVTPVEKVKISVAETPFILTQWRWLDDEHLVMEVETNLGDCFVLDSEHQFTLADDGGIYVNVRRNLLAKVHRNVYYQWIDLATQGQVGSGGAQKNSESEQETLLQPSTELFFISAKHKFTLGYC